MSVQIDVSWSKISDKIIAWLDNLVLQIPNIVVAILVFLLSLLLSKYISKLTRRLLRKSHMKTSMKNLLAKMAAVVTVLLGLFLVLWVLDLSGALKTVLAGAGVAGLAVGLALQGAMANTYSGIVLSSLKFLKLGDWIESNDFEGEIVDIDLRAVTIKQLDNNLVYIPNKLVLENPIKNYSKTAQSRVELNCGVAYNSDLEEVREVVIDTIVKNFNPVKDKEEVIFLYREFADSAITFELRFWINSTSGLEVAKAKTTAIILLKKAFELKNIEIPYPIRTLELPNMDILSKNIKEER